MTPRIVQDGKVGAVLMVHVQPRASHTAYVGVHGNALKIRITAPPVDGAANEELIRFLARELAVPSGAVRIKSGAGGRHKRVCLEGMTAEQAMARLVQKGWLKQ